MKCVRSFALLFVAGSLTAASAGAQDIPSYARGASYSSPSLMPLPSSGPQLGPDSAYPLPPATYQPTAMPYQQGSSRRGAPTNNYGPYVVSARQPSDAPPAPAGSMNEPTPAPAEGGCSSCQAAVQNSGPASNWGGDCGVCLPSYTGHCGWFAEGAGLIMTRDHSNKFWTTYETNNNPNQLLNTKDASDGWGGGFEVTIGNYIDCHNAIEGTYWGLWGLTGFASQRDPNNLLSTPIDLGFVNIGPDPAGAFFDNAREHRIYRNDSLNNVEINWVHDMPSTCNFDVSLLTGFRYFNFYDRLLFESVEGGQEFGDDGGADQAALRISDTNNLFGWQIGTVMRYHVNDRFSIMATPKVGIYDNHMTQNVQLYRGDGLSVYNINSSKDDFSFLAEMDLGGEWQLGCNWRLFGGYRVVGVTGVALSDNQFKPFLADTAGFADLQSNGSLVVHGAFAGLEYKF